MWLHLGSVFTLTKSHKNTCFAIDYQKTMLKYGFYVTIPIKIFFGVGEPEPTL